MNEMIQTDEHGVGHCIEQQLDVNGVTCVLKWGCHLLVLLIDDEMAGTVAKRNGEWCGFPFPSGVVVTGDTALETAQKLALRIAQCPSE